MPGRGAGCAEILPVKTSFPSTGVFMMFKEDIEVGVVNSFDCASIKKCAEIIELERNYGEKSNLPDETRPFVCVGKCNDRSQWAEITKEKAKHRLEIKLGWRSWQDGDQGHKKNSSWKFNNQYINGAVFEGPNDKWAQFATDNNTQGRFKIVTTEGIEAIKKKLTPELKVPLFD